MEEHNPSDFSFYSAMSMDTANKLVTYVVGIGLLVGIPLILGVTFSILHNIPLLLLLPIPFVFLLLGVYFYSPKAIGIKNEKLYILRPIGSLKFDLLKLKTVGNYNYSFRKTGFVWRVWGASGFWGSYGLFWSKKIGRFHAYVTKRQGLLLFQFHNDNKIIISPDKKEDLLRHLKKYCK